MCLLVCDEMAENEQSEAQHIKSVLSLEDEIEYFHELAKLQAGF